MAISTKSSSKPASTLAAQDEEDAKNKQTKNKKTKNKKIYIDR